ncbi:hypothetical protein Taro_044493 [Colocasia esculenta]|uniref:DYW domain-containing protein n=1 Tax=Colocasia esculenta TaxID=4460 RepID=A0A843WJB5_COLES|nr:hypothetical protein [Colocasia esculenta]
MRRDGPYKISLQPQQCGLVGHQDGPKYGPRLVSEISLRERTPPSRAATARPPGAEGRVMEVTTMAQAAQLHAQLIKIRGDDGGGSLALGKLLAFSALSPSGNLAYARAIFDSLLAPNSYCTNTMLRAYARSPHPQEALHFFVSLRRSGLAPDPDNFTYPFLLGACGRLQARRHGRELHSLALKQGLAGDRFIQNSLIHMYASCREVDCAAAVFEGMDDRDVVSWTSIIDGAADGGRPTMALHLFEEMLGEGVVPNDATVVSVLRACADSGALGVGRRVHRIAEERALDKKANVATALIDMYAKCGCIENAEELFDHLVERDVFAWTVMISGLASHGRCRHALNLFDRMSELGVTPDERTITAVLCACRNAGWVSEGQRYFREMRRHGIKPKLQHYGCMVHLLGRAGRLDEAEEMIKSMTIEPDQVLWRALAWASNVHGDMDRAERLMNVNLLVVDSRDSGNYVLLGNIYASSKKWDKKAKVWEAMDQRGVLKPPARSKIEVNGEVHEFEAGDSGHPEAERIYTKLDEMGKKLREEGYIPKVSDVLLDMEEEEKAFQLHHHSERLAVAFGLISTSARERIFVVKNLRSCEDCHNAMKLASKIYNRQIIIRDRFLGLCTYSTELSSSTFSTCMASVWWSCPCRQLEVEHGSVVRVAFLLEFIARHLQLWLDVPDITGRFD